VGNTYIKSGNVCPKEKDDDNYKDGVNQYYLCQDGIINYFNDNPPKNDF